MEEIYNQVNAFRHNPRKYRPACPAPNIKLQDLQINPDLEKAALWQAQHQCGRPSHETCAEYCDCFGNKCDHISRIECFTGPASNFDEILVQGPRRPIKYAVASYGHCQRLLSPDINGMGGAIVGNLFILSLALFNRSAPSPRCGSSAP